LKNNDIGVWDQTDVKRMFNDVVLWGRKSRRTPTNPNEKFYAITGFRQDAAAMITYWRGPDAHAAEHLVEAEHELHD
jgi:hypothetical protein